MIKIGLTGGIGTGKSTISDIFRSENFNIIDADVIAREVLQKNPQILDVIRNEFGTGFLIGEVNSEEENLETIYLNFQNKE